jgi:hypothetical protein
MMSSTTQHLIRRAIILLTLLLAAACGSIVEPYTGPICNGRLLAVSLSATGDTLGTVRERVPCSAQYTDTIAP